MNKKFSILLFTLFISALGFSQTTDFNHQIGISVKASTNGFGGDIYYRPIKTFAIKAGAEYVSLNVKSKTLERYFDNYVGITIPSPGGNKLEFDTNGKLKTGAISLSVGYQPFKFFYVTAGISRNLFASEVIGEPLSDLIFTSQNIPGIGTVKPRISKTNIGIFNIDIKSSNKITPYIGIGLGNFVPQNKNFSFALELGAYYMGSFVFKETMPIGLSSGNIDYGSSITQEQIDQFSESINKEVTTVIADLNKEVHQAINDINKTIESYKIYPVLKLTVGFRMFEFKR